MVTYYYLRRYCYQYQEARNDGMKFSPIIKQGQNEVYKQLVQFRVLIDEFLCTCSFPFHKLSTLSQIRDDEDGCLIGSGDRAGENTRNISSGDSGSAPCYEASLSPASPNWLSH